MAYCDEKTLSSLRKLIHMFFKPGKQPFSAPIILIQASIACRRRSEQSGHRR